MAIWTLHGLRLGKATTRWPAGANSGQAGVLGMPRYRPDRVTKASSECAEVCPTNAIEYREDGGKPELVVDYGRCIACQLCVEASPNGEMEASQDWAFGVHDRTDLRTDDGSKDDKERPSPRRRFRRSLFIRHVDAGSCNGCESELQALNNPFYNLHRFGIFFTASPRFADVLLVTGPVTPQMREPLLATYEAMPGPKWVVATGTCAVSGGLMTDGYSGGNGIGEWLPVDIFIPGCPPNPAAIIEALMLLVGRAPQRVTRGRYGE
jgi:Ni,Fe-hydrogenase III small subunit/Pyruvate/2-oxoacid:ferredoxin oxidoreductase delta subunit